VPGAIGNAAHTRRVCHGDYAGCVPHQPTPTSDPDVPRPARSTSRRQVSRLARLGMVLFGIGLVAVAVILVLFATGSTDLPLWLNLAAMLAPAGFGLGLIGVYLESRSERRAAAARRRSGPSPTPTTLATPGAAQ
jgi:hypothetical protein